MTLRWAPLRPHPLDTNAFGEEVAEEHERAEDAEMKQTEMAHVLAGEEKPQGHVEQNSPQRPSVSDSPPTRRLPSLLILEFRTFNLSQRR